MDSNSLTCDGYVKQAHTRGVKGEQACFRSGSDTGSSRSISDAVSPCTVGAMEWQAPSPMLAASKFGLLT